MHAQNLILIVVIIAVFYLLLILPQRRQQKQRTQMMQQLGVGAQVLTAGGLYGKVISVAGDRYVIQIAPGVDVTMDQRSIVRVVEAAPSAELNAVQAESADESTKSE